MEAKFSIFQFYHAHHVLSTFLNKIATTLSENEKRLLYRGELKLLFGSALLSFHIINQSLLYLTHRVLNEQKKRREKCTHLKCIRVRQSDFASLFERNCAVQLKFMGDGIVGVRRVGLTIVTDEIRFGKEGSCSTTVCADFKGIHLQNAANCVNFFLRVLFIAPLMSYSIDYECLISIPQRRNISTNFVVRFHFIDFLPLRAIDVLQQQTAET